MTQHQVVELKNKIESTSAALDKTKLLEVGSELNIKTGSIVYVRYEDGDSAVFKIDNVRIENIEVCDYLDEDSEIYSEFEFFIESTDSTDEKTQDFLDFILVYIFKDLKRIKFSFAIGGGEEYLFFNSLEEAKNHLLENNIKNTYFHKNL
jgi:hypothetical protein